MSLNPVIDLRVARGSFELDGSLATAITISLESYARAEAGDPIPEGSYPHGWWGDAYGEPGDSFGSRLWTLNGLSPTEIAARAPALAEAALQWMIEDGLLDAVSVTAEAADGGVRLIVEVS